MSIDQILKDQEQEWWQAGKEDEYNVLNKIQRTSCRPIQRKYLECLKQNFDEQMLCDQFKKDMDNCLNILQYRDRNKKSLKETIHENQGDSEKIDQMKYSINIKLIGYHFQTTVTAEDQQFI